MHKSAVKCKLAMHMESGKGHAWVRCGLAALLGFGCQGQAPESGGLIDVMEETKEAPPIAPFTECMVVTGREVVTSAAHVDVCSALDYPRFPPSGGPHFSAWADFGVYEEPVDAGFLVHSLEHGAVTLLYNCPEECPEVEEAFARIREGLVDPLCRSHPAGNRIIIAPEPRLDVAIAAVAWGHVYLATCLDEASLTDFVSAHYAEAPEDLCAPGQSAPGCP